MVDMMLFFLRKIKNDFILLIKSIFYKENKMLLLKRLPVHSFNENIAYVNRECTAYKVDDICDVTRVEIHGGSSPVYAFLNVVDDNRLVKPGELALNMEAFRAMALPEGARVSMVLTEAPQSLSTVHKKIRGGVLTLNEYVSIVNDIRMRKYANMDIAALLTACHSFFTPTEAVNLVKALTAEKNLYWDEEDIVVDTYSLGNIPGNNTDIIVMAIVAAYGLPIPKAVSFNSGTGYGVANTMAVFADINQTAVEVQKIVKENRGVVFNYDVLPVFKTLSVLQEVSRYLNFGDEMFAIVEMLAEKISAGVTHLVVDIPVGVKTLVKTAQQAVFVRKFLEYAGDLLGIHIDAVVTDGREPVGAGIGAMLEARDVMQILHGKENAPKDLREKALFLAGRVLEFDPKLRGGQGYNAAKEILSSGRALEAFNRITTVQGEGRQVDLGVLTRDVLALNSGKVTAVDNQVIAKISLLAGAAQYPGSGLYLMKKNGDKVAKGDVLYRIYACDAGAFALANSFAEANCGYEISRD